MDLSCPDNTTKSRDSRYLKKILTDREMDAILRASDPGALLWAFWACKEAAYKWIDQQTSDAAFVPRRWSVLFDDPFDAHLPEAIENEQRFSTRVVMDENRELTCRVIRTRDWIHAVATDCTNAQDAVVSGVDEIPDAQKNLYHDPSVFVRERLIERVSSLTGHSQNHLAVVRPTRHGQPGPPALTLSGSSLDIPISLSHDGRFTAYTFLL